MYAPELILPPAKYPTAVFSFPVTVVSCPFRAALPIAVFKLPEVMHCPATLPIAVLLFVFEQCKAHKPTATLPTPFVL